MSLDSILRATGKNLFDKSTLTAGTNVVELTQTTNGFTFKTSATSKTMYVGSNIYLPAGTYHCSGTVTCSDANYKGGWAVYDNKTGKFIINASSRGTINDKFTITKSKTYQLNFYAPYYAPVGVIMTFENVQLEKGSTATTYEPYEYLGPKTINLGSGSSGKEVLKVSYNSRNLLPYPWTTTTKTKHGITFTDNGDGSLTISGTATAETYFVLQRGRDYGNKPINAIATESATNGKYAVSKRLYYSNNSKVLSVNILNGATINETIYPQIELGNKATDYVPYFNTVVWTKKA